jgi:hypothetical protein
MRHIAKISIKWDCRFSLRSKRLPNQVGFTQSLSNRKLRDCRFSLRSKRLPNQVGFTQSLSNRKLRFLFGFFYALPFIQASLIHVIA